MTVDQWAAVIGFFLPALVSVINREEWKSWVKAVVALASSVVVGTITALLGGAFTGVNWATAIGIVFAASAASYKLWWKGSGISDKIEQTINIISGKPKIDPDLGGAPGKSGDGSSTE